MPPDTPDPASATDPAGAPAPSWFDRAVEQIDAANALDPNRATFEGREYPAELLYGMRMSEWLSRLEPAASEPLRLAVRCQHLRRWVIPRDTFPMTRAGYHQWRTTLGRFHADEAGRVLRSAGYDEATISRTQSLIRKEGLKSDAEAQTLEDVACLVFLENDFVAFARAHDDEKVLTILVRTWRKMSDRGHRAALELARALPRSEAALVEKAVATAGEDDKVTR